VFPRLELVWADRRLRGHLRALAEDGARLARRGAERTATGHLWRYGWRKPKGFQVIPRRWVVERTFAWLSRSRRLARDHERLPETGEAMIQEAMSRIMLRRIAA
jgi:transposase